MGGKYSKVKGQSFERKVSRILSQWWGTENSFVRTPGSGAFAKFVGDDLAKRISGDLIVPDGFPFAVSIKKNESFNIKDVLFDTSRTLYSWWDEIYTKAKSTNRKPMLIVSKNYDRIWVIFEFDDALCKELGDIPYVIACNAFGVPGLNICIAELEKFLSQLKNRRCL